MSGAGVVTETDSRRSGPSTITLGDVIFDPVSVSDFRLSIEGTSKVGKSNTLAVILEDLADVSLPTLIIERLGALTSVRSEDDNLIVVGAREEEGIDLPVALEELDRVGEWVLDHGRKILVDISTYADYHDERSRVHLAAATALQSLNDRAHTKYRSGSRVKSLLVVDEAHILAPKQGAPEPQGGEYVNRCRGQLIKASTEGGNKGISIITAYQRRAFLHNGVIQLCEDFVAHKPGAEDVDRTADALRCDPADLAQLGTGQILVRGATLSGGELVGPTTVRKRRSPDPREETFQLPEISGETESFLAQIADEVDAEREHRRQRTDELEKLRAENEQLRGTVEQLEQELADSERLATALDALRDRDPSGIDSITDRVSHVEEQLEALQTERDRAVERVESMTRGIEALLERNQQLSRDLVERERDLRELRGAVDVTADSIHRLARALTGEGDPSVKRTADGDAGGRLDNRYQACERAGQRLDARISTQLASYEALVELEIVSTQLDAATASVCERYVHGVVAAIVAERGWIRYDTIAERLGVSTTTDVSKAATELERRQLVRKDRRADGVYVDLDREGIQELHMEAVARERTVGLMEQL